MPRGSSKKDRDAPPPDQSHKSWSDLFSGGASAEAAAAAPLPNPTEKALKEASAQIQKEREEAFDAGTVLQLCDMMNINPPDRAQLEAQAEKDQQEKEGTDSQPTTPRGRGRPRKNPESSATTPTRKQPQEPPKSGVLGRMSQFIPTTANQRCWARINEYWAQFGQELHGYGYTPLPGRMTDYTPDELDQYEGAIRARLSSFDHEKFLQRALKSGGKGINEILKHLQNTHPLMAIAYAITVPLETNLVAAYEYDPEYRRTVKLASIDLAGFIPANPWVNLVMSLYEVITNPRKYYAMHLANMRGLSGADAERARQAYEQEFQARMEAMKQNHPVDIQEI